MDNAMLPPAWKGEIQKAIEVETAADRDQRDSAATEIAAAITNLGDAQNAQTRSEDRNEIKDRRISIATLFLVLLTVVFTYLTWRTLSGQLDEMKTAGEQTKQLIDTNAKLVDAATKQAEAATENAKISRDSFVASERAWVGPRAAKINSAPVADKDLAIVLEYGNTGREPAIETVTDTDVFAATEEEIQSGKATQRVNDFIGKCKAMWKPDQASVVYPSVGLSAASYALTKTMQKSDIDDDVVSGAKTIVFSGCFSYRTTETIHRSWFCYFYKAGKTENANWSICTTGNGAD
jgi:hypothetical protein